jgi:sugar/nucleoside kinase (ribokinase family)
MFLVTFGDVLLDVIVRTGEPLVPGADTRASTNTGAGGQAANVAAWAAALGANARCVGKRGDDAAGRLVATELEEHGVELAGPVGERTGVVVSLVAPDGERTMASDRGVAPELAPEDLDPEWFACDCLHISGYALLAAPIDRAALRAGELARASGARISVDLSAWTQISTHERFRESLEQLAPDVLFGNEEEWKAIGSFAGVHVVKRGARGFDVIRGGAVERCQARDMPAVDGTGAGDALAAGFLVGGTELAAEAAARCVAKLGAMP